MMERHVESARTPEASACASRLATGHCSAMRGQGESQASFNQPARATLPARSGDGSPLHPWQGNEECMRSLARVLVGSWDVPVWAGRIQVADPTLLPPEDRLVDASDSFDSFSSCGSLMDCELSPGPCLSRDDQGLEDAGACMHDGTTCMVSLSGSPMQNSPAVEPAEKTQPTPEPEPLTATGSPTPSIEQPLADPTQTPAPMPERTTPPCTLAANFCTEVRRALTPILARLLDRVPPGRRPRKKRSPVSNPRRSVRLARGVGKGSAASKQQRVLIRRLCLANECEEITDEDLLMYGELFKTPLNQDQIAVILALFGWDASILPLHDEVAGGVAGH